jgi:hypothetical protein
LGSILRLEMRNHSVKQMKSYQSNLSIFTICVFALSVGCRSPSGDQTLLGEWEVTDLTKIEHVSQFAGAVFHFQPDGVFKSYLIDRTGEKIEEEPASYRIHQDILMIGMIGDPDGGTHYRFLIKDNTLSLKVIKALNDGDIGRILTLRRKK